MSNFSSPTKIKSLIFTPIFSLIYCNPYGFGFQNPQVSDETYKSKTACISIMSFTNNLSGIDDGKFVSAAILYPLF